MVEEQLSYYPLFLDLRMKKVLVVGGGEVARRKIQTLLECGAEVYVLARRLSPHLQKDVQEGRIKMLGPEFHDDHLKGCFLVIAATDDPELNHRISEKAKENGQLINAVDQPADCNVIVPAILRRGDLFIAVSTSGKSPALAKRIRAQLEQQFGQEYEAFLILMGSLRKDILSRGLSSDENRRIFQNLVDADVLEAIRTHDWKALSSTLNRILGEAYSPEEIEVLLARE